MEKINGKSFTEKAGHTCFITHASRVDLIMGLHTHVRDKKHGDNFQCGLILSCSNDVSIPGEFANIQLYRNDEHVLAGDRLMWS